jgi:hypothetical protein
MFTDTDKQAIAQFYKLAQAMNHTLEALSKPVAASDAGAALARSTWAAPARPSRRSCSTPAWVASCACPTS